MLHIHKLRKARNSVWGAKDTEKGSVALGRHRKRQVFTESGHNYTQVRVRPLLLGADWEGGKYM